MSPASAPPCHCPEPPRRSSSGRNSIASTSVAFAGSVETTVIPKKRMNGEPSSTVWIRSAVIGGLAASLIELLRVAFLVAGRGRAIAEHPRPDIEQSRQPQVVGRGEL